MRNNLLIFCSFNLNTYISMRRIYTHFITLTGNRHYRLYVSIVLALVVFILSRKSSSGVVSFMITWITFSVSNLISSWIIILLFHPRKVKAIADKEDSSGAFIFVFIVMAAFISLFAIIILLQSVPTESKRGLSLHILFWPLLQFPAHGC